MAGRGQDMSLRPPSIEDTVVAQSRKVRRRRVVVKTARLPFGMCAQKVHQSSHGYDDENVRIGRMREENKAARRVLALPLYEVYQGRLQ